jgi:hypothetical protein
LWSTALAATAGEVYGDFLFGYCAVSIFVGVLHHLLETLCLLGDFVFGELAVLVGVEASQKRTGRNRPATTATRLATLRKSSLTPEQSGQ